MFKKDNTHYTQIFLICIISAGLHACQKNNLGSFPDSGENKKVYNDLLEHNSDKVNAVSTAEVLGMQEIVKNLSKKEIENLTEEEVLSIGQPILDLTENTIKVDQSALEEMNRYFEEIKKELDTISQEEHEILSKKIDEAIAESFVRETQYRSFTTPEMRNILFKIHDLNTMSFLCEDLFHVSGGNTFLFPGDNLNLANTLCPAGSYFYMTGGIYTGQQIISSKSGNYWVGAGAWQAILNGQQTMSRAFVGAMNNNNFRWFEIKNYTDHGIYSGTGSVNNITIANMIFSNIGGTRNGQEFGAIMLLYATNVLIENSYFENVTSSIRFRFSNGPLQIINNEALNSGRNFFQCGDCNGGGIKINHNSMEYVSSYGTVPLEDWINIFDSAGLSNDPIQVNYNRLKGHASSPTSICINLGDHGGQYQQAVGNVGVNCGVDGVGTRGGDYMEVKDNKMYAAQWAHSLTAFTSYDFCESFYGTGHSCGTCTNHVFDNNTAHWTNKDGMLTRAWSNGSCGISNTQIRNLTIEDTSMGPEIW